MIKFLEQLVYWWSSYARGCDIDDLCALEAPVINDETNDREESFVLAEKNRDLISVIEIRGARRYIGRQDEQRMVEAFAKALEKRMRAGSGNQHSFAVGFRSDPSAAGELIEQMLAPQRQTAKVLGITNLRMLDERKKALARLCTDETVYLVIRTHARDIHPHEKKIEADERAKRLQTLRKASGAGMDQWSAQTAPYPMGSLLPKHQAAVKALLDDLSRDLSSGGAQLLARVLGVHDAIVAIRRHVQAAMISDGWRPRLLGDKHGVLGSRANGQAGESAWALPMRLSRQMVSSSVRDHFGARELAEHEGIWYGSVVLELCPEQGSESFARLAERIGRSIPWRASFEVLPNGQHLRALEKMLAAFLAAFGDYNKGIRQAHDELRRLVNEGVYVAGFRMVLTTWAPTEKEALMAVSNLVSAVESWGAARCTNETGEPARAMLASAAGFSAVSPAPFLPAPIEDVARMLPIGRPASVWQSGQLLLSTIEGRPYPVQFGSSMQAYWSTIGFAPTGSGKSFTLNVLNSGLLLAPGAREVPPITLVDVGKSGALVMNWFRSILPPHLKAQVQAVTLRNHIDFAINPFDTQHGFDEPLPEDVDFLIAVLGTLAPGCGPEADKFFERIIRAAYEKYSRKSPDARRWQDGLDEKVARALREAMPEIVRHPQFQNFRLDEHTTVWEVVDALFAVGRIEESISAQRFAMPTMQDLAQIAQQPKVFNLYGTAQHNGELIIDIFKRNINASLNSYEILSGVTRFNLGAARAVAIDLQEVVGTMTSEEGRRRSGLMFLLARRIGARNYFLKWEDVAKYCPPLYANYQRRRIEKLWETIKFLQYDEAHYFSGVQSVVRLVEADLRTGRKFNLVSAMFSQLLDDFSPSLIENTYIFLIMGLGDASPQRVREIFALSEDEMNAIQRYCVRPGTLFARFKTRAGVLSQVLHLHASAYEKWCFTTQGRDQTLRAVLVERMGSVADALDLLTDRFPSGTAEPWLNRLASEVAQDGVEDDALAQVAARMLLQEMDRKDIEKAGQKQAGAQERHQDLVGI